MIKLGKYIRISPLLPVLCVICVVTGQRNIFVISYFTVFLHELAHLAAAKAIGLRVDSVAFRPFGVNLRLKNRIIFSVSDEVILYAAGPAFNVLCALAISIIGLHSPFWDYFYTCSVVLFFVNILPVAPLDGGMILKKVIGYYFGYKTADRCIKTVSAIILMLMSAVELAAAVSAGINYSVILMLLFLTGNIFTQEEKFNIDFVHELMFSDRKSTARGKIIVIRDGEDRRTAAKSFDRGSYGIIVVVNKDGEIVETLTEKQVMDSMLSEG